MFAVSSFARQVVKFERQLAEKAQGEHVLEVGNLQVRRDYCDVRDIVRAYSMAAEGQVPQGTYNLASGVATPLSRIVDLLRQLSHRSFEVRVSKERLRAGEVLTLSGSPRKIESVSGWKASIPLEASVLDTLEWWRRSEDV
jgi:GDP-4-dehydro-6-deoxy-D-mannose reductase